jgi:hypothetical protein
MEAVNLISSPKYSEKQIVRMNPALISYSGAQRLHYSLTGIPRGDTTNARKLGLPSTGSQFGSEGSGLYERD